MEACVFQGTFDESIVYDDNMIDDLRDMAVAILGMHLNLELVLIWLRLYNKFVMYAPAKCTPVAI